MSRPGTRLRELQKSLLEFLDDWDNIPPDERRSALCAAMFVSKRPLTEAEMEHGRTLEKELSQD